MQGGKSRIARRNRIRHQISHCKAVRTIMERICPLPQLPLLLAPSSNITRHSKKASVVSGRGIPLKPAVIAVLCPVPVHEMRCIAARKLPLNLTERRLPVIRMDQLPVRN